MSGQGDGWLSGWPGCSLRGVLASWSEYQVLKDARGRDSGGRAHLACVIVDWVAPVTIDVNADWTTENLTQIRDLQLARKLVETLFGTLVVREIVHGIFFFRHIEYRMPPNMKSCVVD